MSQRPDYERIKEALISCRQTHKKCCQVYETSGLSIQVIDCRTKMVVPLPPKEAYIYLSYVWADDMADEMEDNVSGHFPATIDNAIFVAT